LETLIQTALDADGVLVATIDMPGRTMNVFSAAMMNALDALMDRIDTDAAVRSVVLTSGKPSFLAGADLAMVCSYWAAAAGSSWDQMFKMCGRLGRQMVRLEQSDKPWVAAVNGLALGGGLELAMACRARLVADDPKIQLGLPEVRLGLLPGAGGTQRMPRLIGFESAMDLLLSGRSINPQRALATGLFEGAAPASRLLEDAKAVARRLHGTSYEPRTKFAHFTQEDVPPHVPDAARSIALQYGITAADVDCYPAYVAIVDSVLLGSRKSLANATDVEMHQFLRLVFSPVAENMVRTMFLNRQRADRELAPPADLQIQQVGAGAISPTRSAWSEALAKSKLTVSDNAALPDDTIELIDNRGSRHVVAVRVLADASCGDEPTGAFAVLTPSGPFGSVLEIVGANNAAAVVLGALAARLRALPYRSNASRSALFTQARVPREDADGQALAALSRASSTPIGDADFYDLAACVAGVAPLWSGGPFTHLWREHVRLEPRFVAAQAEAWERIEPVLRSARA
jgi:3-hydroxyacyl-CoA dehydrogenase/enoyl-CoA hydratase/3-hydroxybutyryl-CoA epimerase